MSEAIIARGGKGIGGTVDLSGINSSLLTINTRINQINSNVASLWDTVNDIGNGALDTATNSSIGENSYYNCTKTGNYWVEIVGGGGASEYVRNGLSFSSYSGYLNNGRVYLSKGEQVYVTIGAGGRTFGSGTGGITTFGPYLSANGGSIAQGGNAPTRGFGGWLYYNSSNSRRMSISGYTRLYFGEGGSYEQDGIYANRAGNSGYCIITYMD